MDPFVIAGWWILTSAAWAALSPLEESVVAEVCGERAGRGMSLLGNAALAGTAIGSVTGGAVYEAVSWAWACFILAALPGAAAALGPVALRRMEASDSRSV